MAGWAGVDVGGTRKGLHVAWIDPCLHVHLQGFQNVRPRRAARQAAGWLRDRAPELVAVDSPDSWADSGERARDSEREFLAARICGIRPTPSRATAEARRDRYYEWIWNGLLVYEELEAAGLEAVECFPTASWTQWLGPRTVPRAEWTRGGIRQLQSKTALQGLDGVRSQDRRDALAAALTARLWAREGEEASHRWARLVVPRPGTLLDAAR